MDANDANGLFGLLDGLNGQIPQWLWAVLAVALIVGLKAFGKKSGRGRPRTPGRPIAGAGKGQASPGQFGATATRDLPTSEIQRLKPRYDPKPDGLVDPGEIVWTWVPYAENNGQGKDRPVLIIARIDAHSTAGCYLSTKEHHGFVSIGTGPWDRSGRESFVSPERILKINNDGVRREGQVLAQQTFDRAVTAISRQHGIRA